MVNSRLIVLLGFHVRINTIQVYNCYCLTDTKRKILLTRNEHTQYKITATSVHVQYS